MEVKGFKYEYEVADLLGFKRVAFSERKKRNSVPVAEIKLFCLKESINPNWIFFGVGERRVGPYEQLQEAPQAFSDQTPRMEGAPLFAVTGLMRKITPEQEELLRCWDQMDEGKRQTLMDVARSLAGFVGRSEKSGNEENGLPDLKSTVK